MMPKMKLTALVHSTLIIFISSEYLLAQDNSRWIVVDNNVAETFETKLETKDRAKSAFSIFESIGGRTVARIHPTIEKFLQQVVHKDHHQCGAYTIHPTREAAWAEANNKYYAPNYKIESKLLLPPIDQQKAVIPALNQVNNQEINATILKLQELKTRYYQSDGGVSAALKIKDQWESYGNGRLDYSVILYQHCWRQNSVIATIRGNEFPDEYIVIGGHLDSISHYYQTDAPGADDDASGIAVVSEVLRVLIASDFRPKRTLQFMAYSAEEVGILGSREIAKAYKASGKKVNGVMQMDMTGYAGSSKNMYFVTNYTNNDLNNFVMDLIDEYNGQGQHQITYGGTECDYPCSDHIAWTGTGVPATYPVEAKFSEFNHNIHKRSDTLSNMDMSGNHVARFAKLGIEFMIELGKSSAIVP